MLHTKQTDWIESDCEQFMIFHIVSREVFFKKKKDREKLDRFESFTTGSTGIKTPADDREYWDQINIKSLIVQFNLFQMRTKKGKNNFNQKLVLHVFFCSIHVTYGLSFCPLFCYCIYVWTMYGRHRMDIVWMVAK